MPFEGTAMPGSGLAQELTSGPLPVVLRRFAEVLESVPETLASLSVTFYGATFITVQVAQHNGSVVERLALTSLLAKRFELPAPGFKVMSDGSVHFGTPYGLDMTIFTGLSMEQAAEVGAL